MAHERLTSHIEFCRAYEDNPHRHKQCTVVYLLQKWTHTHMTLAPSSTLFRCLISKYSGQCVIQSGWQDWVLVMLSPHNLWL